MLNKDTLVKLAFFLIALFFVLFGLFFIIKTANAASWNQLCPNRNFRNDCNTFSMPVDISISGNQVTVNAGPIPSTIDWAEEHGGTQKARAFVMVNSTAGYDCDGVGDPGFPADSIGRQTLETGDLYHHTFPVTPGTYTVRVYLWQQDCTNCPQVAEETFTYEKPTDTPAPTATNTPLPPTLTPTGTMPPTLTPSSTLEPTETQEPTPTPSPTSPPICKPTGNTVCQFRGNFLCRLVYNPNLAINATRWTRKHQGYNIPVNWWNMDYLRQACYEFSCTPRTFADWDGTLLCAPECKMPDGTYRAGNFYNTDCGYLTCP